MNFNGTRSTLQGTVNTRQGQIASAATPTGRRLTTGARRLRQQPVRITVPPMVRLDVSPDVFYRHAKPV
jgi:translocation and assembly module TamB